MLAVINDTGIIVVLVGAVLLFGANRIPKLARNLGEASREFKSAQDDAHLSPVADVPALSPRSEPVTMTRDQLDALLANAGGHAGQAEHTQAAS